MMPAFLILCFDDNINLHSLLFTKHCSPSRRPMLLTSNHKRQPNEIGFFLVMSLMSLDQIQVETMRLEI
jgi:hypothetical protein